MGTVPERKPLRSKPLRKVVAHRDRRIVLNEVIRTGLSAGQAVRVLEALRQAVETDLKVGGLVAVRGLGTFYVRIKPGGTRRDPRNGRLVSVLPEKVPVLRFAREFVAAIDEAKPEATKLKRGRPVKPDAKVRR